MAKPTTTVITVEGRGSFPIDMLRHDACYPRSQQDVNKIIDDRRGDGMQFVQVVHHVLKDENIASIPTTERWSSFGWRVAKVERF